MLMYTPQPIRVSQQCGLWCMFQGRKLLDVAFEQKGEGNFSLGKLFLRHGTQLVVLLLRLS